jgi:hypothetical protein
MRAHNKTFKRPVAGVCLLACFFTLSLSSATRAGCGCDKPPPAPAAVIPNVAFTGMSVTLFHTSFQAGQTWTVEFHNGTAQITTAGIVATKRAITDPTGATYTPQLTIVVPSDIPAGPTSIVASASGSPSLIIPETSFTIIGAPVMFTEQNVEYTVKNYSTGVDVNGILYMAAGGFNSVCKVMRFQTRLDGFPLRFGNGDVMVINHQGFLVDALVDPNDPALGVRKRFSVIKKKQDKSNRLIYRRHSFAQYCADHQPGGAKAVDPQDPNWHLDGTLHVDYSTLIFAVDGHFDNGAKPAEGSATFALQVESEIDRTRAPWTVERNEEILQ